MTTQEKRDLRELFAGDWRGREGLCAFVFVRVTRFGIREEFTPQDYASLLMHGFPDETCGHA